MDNAMEDRMIEAHQHGMAYARELDASLRAARNKAKAYATEPEQESFVAGYVIAQLKQMLG